ncbi:MAG: hypothetical protein MUF03_14495, partial [Rubrivivax sp.]|nr:hypothetical protein [Rubrivivax sp.]
VTPDGLSNRTLSGSGTASLWDGNGTLFVDGPGPNDKFTNTLGDCDPFTNLCNGRFNTTGATSSTTAENKVSGDWWEAVTEFEIRIKQGFGVGAFGFYGTDIGDFAGSLSISLFERDDQSEDEATKVTVFPQQSGLGDSGSLLFFGVVDRDRLFTKIRFNIRQSSDQLDSLGFDDLVFGNLREIPTEPEPMPLPGTAALALLGIGLLAGTRARRRG